MNGRALPVARIAGIEIRVHLSWVPALALITVLIAVNPYEPAVQGGGLIQFVVGGAIALFVLASVGAHELAHSLVARRRGLAVGPIILGAMSGIARTDDEPRTAADELAISSAGPVVSLLLGVTLVAVSVAVQWLNLDVAFAVAIVGAANLLLGLCNLVPALPLDGGRVVHAIVWSRTGDPLRSGRTTARVGRWVGLIVLGAGLLESLFGDAVTGILLVVSGWFLTQGSRVGDRRARIEALLTGLSVEQAMERDVPGIGPGLTIDTFAEQLLTGGERTSVPVVGDGSLLGLVGIGQLRRIARRRWPELRAADVMVAVSNLPRLGAGDALWNGMELLRRSGLDGVPVMADSALLGILTRRAVATVIQARAAADPGVLA